MVVQNLLVEGLLSTEAFLFLGFKFAEFLLTCFTGVPLKPHFVEFCLELKVSILTEVKVLDKLSEEGLKLDKILDH